MIEGGGHNYMLDNFGITVYYIRSFDTEAYIIIQFVFYQEFIFGTINIPEKKCPPNLLGRSISTLLMISISGFFSPFYWEKITSGFPLVVQ